MGSNCTTRTACTRSERTCSRTWVTWLQRPGTAPRPLLALTTHANVTTSSNRRRASARDETDPRKRILGGHPLTGVGRFPNLAGGPAGPAARDLPLLPTCITMHRRSPAELPDVCRVECV